MAVLPRHLAWFAGNRLRLVTGFIHINRNEHCRFHSHDQVEAVLHRGGRGVCRVDGGVDLAFGPGQATFHPPGSLHDQLNQEPGEDVCLLLDPGPDPPAILLRPQLATVPGSLAQEFAALATAPAQRTPAEQLSLDLRATGVVLGVLSAVDAGGGAIRHGAAGVAARYLAEHLATVGRMEEVARHVGLSVDRLRHLFTAAHRIGPVEYLIRLRLEHARGLLERTDLGMEEVARACGFATARYFSTLFHRRKGCTPSVWRRRARLWSSPRR